VATRFYFPATTAADVTPVANGTWGDTDGALNRRLVPGTKSNTALASGTSIVWTAGATALDRRYVSPPLDGAQTVSGTVKGYLMQAESATNDNARNRLEIYVVSGDGQTVRGTCLAIGQYGPDVELNTALRNKALCDGDTISSVSAQSGDRIVVCIGYADVTGSSISVSSLFGDPTAGTDLAENETNTTQNPGWIEFSATLAFTNEGSARAAHRAGTLVDSHPVQIVQAQLETTDDVQSNSITLTPASAPTVGNLLILIVNPDKSQTAITGPTGFTAGLPEEIEWANTETSCRVFHKIATGSDEASFTPTWTQGATIPRPTVGFVELSSTTGWHATPIDDTAFSASATLQTNRGSVTVTPSAAFTGKVLAFVTTDSCLSVTGGTYTWGDGFATVISPPAPGAGSDGNAALGIAVKSFTASATAHSPSATYSGTADGGGIAALIIRAADATGTEATERAAQSAILEASPTARKAHISTLEAVAVAAIAIVATLEATATSRVSHTAELDKVSETRAAHDALPEATETHRVSHLASFDDSDTEATARVSHLSTAEAAGATRAAHLGDFGVKACQFTDAGNTRLSNTTNLPSPSALTIAGWVKIDSFTSAWNCIWNLGHTTAGANYFQVVGQPNGSDVEFYTTDPPAGFPFFTPTVGAWHFIAITVNGTGAGNCKTYHSPAGGGALTEQTRSLAGLGYSPTALWFGSDEFNEDINGRLAGWRVWDHALSAVELATEAGRISAAKTTGLLADLRMQAAGASSGNDSSALADNYSVAGTPALVQGPPVFLDGPAPSGTEDTARGAHTVSDLEKTVTARAAHGSTLEQEAAVRAAHLASVEATSSARAAQTSGLEAIGTGRAAHMAEFADSTSRAAHLALLEAASGGRAAHLSTLEVAASVRAAHKASLKLSSATVGVMLRRLAGAMTDTTAEVVVNAPADGAVNVHVYNETTHAFVGTFSGTATNATNKRWVKVSCTGLTANTSYYYLVEYGALQEKGRFTTHPTPGTAASFTFVFGSCTQNGSTADTFARMKAKNPRFYVNLGDMEYRDYTSVTEDQVLGIYSNVQNNLTQMDFYANQGLHYVWSDHDYGSPNDGTMANKANVISAYKKAIPHYPLDHTGSTDPVCQSWVVGRVRFVLTDCRTQRSPSGNTDNSSKTMLGATQKQWFKDQITAAKAAGQFVIWALELNWNGTAGQGILGSDDGWDKYTTERAEIANHLASVGMTDRMIAIMGDAHMIAVDSGTQNYATAGSCTFPLIHGGGVDRTGSAKGGPFSVPADATIGASADSSNHYAPGTTNHYGWVDVVDSGGDTIQVHLRCYDENDAHNTNVQPYRFTSASLNSETTARVGHASSTLDKTDETRTAETATLEETATARAAQSATAEATATARTGHTTSLDAPATARTAETATLEATATARAAETATLEETATARAAQIASLDAPATDRTGHTAFLDAPATDRTGHTAFLDAPATARTAETATLEATATARAAQSATTEATATERAAQSATAEATATERAAQTVSTLDKADTGRLSHLAEFVQSVTERVAHVASGDKTEIARVAQTALLETGSTSRGAHTAGTQDKTSEARAAEFATLEAAAGDRASQIASLEAAAAARAAHGASLLLPEGESRTGHTALLESFSSSRVSHTAGLEPEGTSRTAEIATLEAANAVRAAHTATPETREDQRIAHAASLDAEGRVRAASVASLEATGTDRMCHSAFFTGGVEERRTAHTATLQGGGTGRLAQFTTLESFFAVPRLTIASAGTTGTTGSSVKLNNGGTARVEIRNK
jgi:hypothetical protein